MVQLLARLCVFKQQDGNRGRGVRGIAWDVGKCRKCKHRERAFLPDFYCTCGPIGFTFIGVGGRRLAHRAKCQRNRRKFNRDCPLDLLMP